MKRMINLFSLILCVLLLSSCNTTKQENTVILLRQKTTTASVTTAIRVERVMEESKIADQKTEYQSPKTMPAGSLSWLAEEIDAGSPSKLIKYFDVTYDYYGNELSKTHVYDLDETIPSSSRIRQYGSVLKEGTYFKPKFSRYGLDCVGCGGEFDGSGNTATGVKLNKELGVQQANGSWQPGITWEGFYIVAADKRVPFCTIVEISNHNFSGNGLTPGKAFQAIVVDRGGSIKEVKLDLYVGTETNLNSVKYVANKVPLAKIIRVGGVLKKNGKQTCKV